MNARLLVEKGLHCVEPERFRITLTAVVMYLLALARI